MLSMDPRLPGSHARHLISGPGRPEVGAWEAERRGAGPGRVPADPPTHFCLNYLFSSSSSSSSSICLLCFVYLSELVSF